MTTYQTIQFPAIDATMPTLLETCNDCGATVVSGQQYQHSMRHQKIER